MTTLMRASNEWSKRAADERFTSLDDLHAAAMAKRNNAARATVRIRDLKAAVLDNQLILNGRVETTANFSNWSFGQFCKTAQAPAAYMRTLPVALAAECINNGLQRADDKDDSALLFDKTPNGLALRAITTDSYVRVWNSEITSRLQELQARGPWQPAPAAFDGSRGLYMGDRDLFAFMVDSNRRIFEKLPGGGLSRGFFVWNSEVGAASFGIQTFFYEYVCGNHRVWGASGVKEIRLRHVGDVNGRAFSNMAADLTTYADSSAADDELKIESARRYVLGHDRDAVLDRIFGLRIPALTRKLVSDAYDLAERRVDWYGNPRSAWGMAGALTEIGRDMVNADDRVATDRAGSKLMEIAF